MVATTMSPLTHTHKHTIRTQLRNQILQVKLKDGSGWIEAGGTPEGTVNIRGRSAGPLSARARPVKPSGRPRPRDPLCKTPSFRVECGANPINHTHTPSQGTVVRERSWDLREFLSSWALLSKIFWRKANSSGRTLDLLVLVKGGLTRTSPYTLNLTLTKSNHIRCKARGL